MGLIEVEKPLQHPALKTRKHGVWTIISETGSIVSIQSIARAITLLGRFFYDVFWVTPGLCTLYMLYQAISSLESVTMIALSDRLMFTDGLLLIVFVFVTGLMDFHLEKIGPLMQTRITHYFEERILFAQLNLDVPTSQRIETNTQFDAGSVFEDFKLAVSGVGKSISIASQLWILTRTFHGTNTNTLLFICVCLLEPLLDIARHAPKWTMGSHLIYSENQSYTRSRSILEIGRNAAYRMEVNGGNLNNFLLQEYHQARQELGDSLASGAIESPISLLRNILYRFSVHTPTVYAAVTVLRNPSRFSISSFVSLRLSSQQLQYSIYNISLQSIHMQDKLWSTRQLYDFFHIRNFVQDGVVTYPISSDSESESNSQSKPKGMALELRNISFTYPTAKPGVQTLTDISCQIPAGSLVVVVGGNGSGKTTLSHLITRVYDVSSGIILVDDTNIKSFKRADLRGATAILTQDHPLFPLSLRENIGLGFPKQIHDQNMVDTAATKGGSKSFINKLPDAFETVLNPCKTLHPTNASISPILRGALAQIETHTDISGGEKQRLAASRTFMRLNSGKVKLVVIDEPSSSIDPQGELELFENFRNARDGKTMIFITHRFGHLTKYADLILCMKNGKLVEQGTHSELLGRRGEYHKLYSIQADAFSVHGI